MPPMTALYIGGGLAGALVLFLGALTVRDTDNPKEMNLRLVWHWLFHDKVYKARCLHCVQKLEDDLKQLRSIAFKVIARKGF